LTLNTSSIRTSSVLSNTLSTDTTFSFAYATEEEDMSTCDELSLPNTTPRDDLVFSSRDSPSTGSTPRDLFQSALVENNIESSLDLPVNNNNTNNRPRFQSLKKYKVERTASLPASVYASVQQQQHQQQHNNNNNTAIASEKNELQAHKRKISEFEHREQLVHVLTELTQVHSSEESEISNNSGTDELDDQKPAPMPLKRGNTLISLHPFIRGRSQTELVKRADMSLSDLNLSIDDIFASDDIGGVASLNIQIGTATNKQREFFDSFRIGRHLSFAENIQGINRAQVNEQLQYVRARAKSMKESASAVLVIKPEDYECNRVFLLGQSEVDVTFKSIEEDDDDDDEKWDGIYVNSELMEVSVEIINELHEPEIATLNVLYEEEIIYLNPLFEPVSHSIYITNNIEEEEAVLIEAMKKDIKRRDKRVSTFVVKKHVFTGAELVDWIQKRANFHLLREDCVYFAQQLMDRYIFKCSNMSDKVLQDSNNHYYRFAEEYMSPECLNILPEEYGIYRAPSTHDIVSRRVSALLERIIAEFQNKRNENDRADRLIMSHTFDYRGLSESDLFHQLKFEVASPLHKLELYGMAYNEKLAFFLNIHNVFIIHALITCGRPTNMILRQQFFKLTKYVIGRFKLSLDNIYHGILRGALFRTEQGERIPNNNSPHGYDLAATVHNIPRFFATSQYHEYVIDQLGLRPFDKRIHFALFQGNLSSPKLMVFHPDRIDDQLEEATREFISNNTQINFKSNTISLCKIFEWYRQDFGRDEKDVLTYIMPYLDVDQRGRLSFLLREENEGKYNVEYHYEWKLNNRLNAQDKQVDNTEVLVELDEVRNDAAYRQYFMRYCEVEHSTENLEFWVEAQKFKKMKDPIRQIKLARKIQKVYLSPTSLKEINVSRSLILKVEQQITKAAERIKIKARPIDITATTPTTPTDVDSPSTPLPSDIDTPRTPIPSAEEEQPLPTITTEPTNNEASSPLPPQQQPSPQQSQPPTRKKKELLLPVTLFDRLEEEMEMVMSDTFARFKQHELYQEMIQKCVTEFIIDNLAGVMEGEDAGEVDFFEALKAKQVEEDTNSDSSEKEDSKRFYDPLRLFKSILYPQSEDVTASDQEFLQRNRESFEKKRRGTKKAGDNASFKRGSREENTDLTMTSSFLLNGASKDQNHKSL
jgi:hypothetical protein